MADMKSAEIKPTQFGSWLKTEREARGLKGRQLAPIADTTHASISRYETGERHPSKQMALRIAIAIASFEDDESLRSRIINDGLNAAGYVKSVDSQDSAGASVLTEPVENQITYGLPDDLAPILEGYNDLPAGTPREVARRQMMNALEAVRLLVRGPGYGADGEASGRHHTEEIARSNAVARHVPEPEMDDDIKALRIERIEALLQVLEGTDDNMLLRPDEFGVPLAVESREGSGSGLLSASKIREYLLSDLAALKPEGDVLKSRKTSAQN